LIFTGRDRAPEKINHRTSNLQKHRLEFRLYLIVNMKGICHIACISAPYGGIMLFLLIMAMPADISAPEGRHYGSNGEKIISNFQAP
jgi:hypothetical protein